MKRRLFFMCFSALILVLAMMPSRSEAADLEMVDAFGNVTGVIDVSAAGLSVFENSGDRFFYQRAPQYDLPGGRYLGFYNLELNRIIRFPRSGNGPVERADLDARIPRFIPATVSVRPIGSGRGFGPYLSGWITQPLATSRLRGGFPSIGSNSGYGVGGYRAGGYGWTDYGFGNPIGSFGGIHLEVTPQMIPFRSPQPRSVLLQSNVVQRNPLSPIEVEFFNSHNEQLVVTLTDSQNPSKQPQYTIDPGDSKRVKLPRDNGHTRVDVYQTTDVTGLPIEQEVRVNVPPTARFEVVVHRVRIQSIAIDRTGKSPHPIEDINRQGIGVGRFKLPPGDQLTSGRIDVFAAAREANNPGSIAPIVSQR